MGLSRLCKRASPSRMWAAHNSPRGRAPRLRASRTVRRDAGLAASVPRRARLILIQPSAASESKCRARGYPAHSVITLCARLEPVVVVPINEPYSAKIAFASRSFLYVAPAPCSHHRAEGRIVHWPKIDHHATQNPRQPPAGKDGSRGTIAGREKTKERKGTQEVKSKKVRR